MLAIFKNGTLLFYCSCLYKLIRAIYCYNKTINKVGLLFASQEIREP